MNYDKNIINPIPVCSKIQITDITGQTFNRLTVLGYSHRRNAVTYWVCECTCGGRVITRGSSLRNGHTKSCGCLNTETRRAQVYKHGMVGHPLYSIWTTMRSRCLCKTDKGFHNYGARGIKICPEWDDFAQFVKDMGERPSVEYTLDRIDNDGDYTPENCHWGTEEEQNNNKRTNVFITYQGKRQTLVQWSRELKISYAALQYRRRQGWDIHKMFTTPVAIRPLRKTSGSTRNHLDDISSGEILSLFT